MARPPADVNYTFDAAELARLAAYGEVQGHAAGECLVRTGERRADLLVTLSGQTHIFVDEPEGRRRVGYMEAGQFAGDLAVLTGQASLAEIVMGESGEVLHIPFERLQRLLVEDSHLSDILVRTLAARRAFARSDASGSVVVVGTPFSRATFTLRDLLNKHSIPHRWLDPDTDAVAGSLMEAYGLSAGDLPAVIRGAAGALRAPGPAELAEAFGFDLVPDGSQADVIIVGAGPAGLAAAVYAASEGLGVIVMDSSGPGGQAGTSSKIENYLGFPTGISGQDLAERASIQAQKFGVRFAAPAHAAALLPGAQGYDIECQDGRRLSARAVVIATGAQYRRLDLDGLERLEGRGVYYGASALEAQLCSGSAVTIVGAGNSAGQGAVFLSRTASEVHVVYRRADIRETMSDYLVRRLVEAPNIHLHPESEIAALHACGSCAASTEARLEAVSIRERAEMRPWRRPFSSSSSARRPSPGGCRRRCAATRADSCSPARRCSPITSCAPAGAWNACRPGTRPACRASMPWAMCARTPSSAWRAPSGKAPSWSATSTTPLPRTRPAEAP